jgi:hypothetical protein
MCVDDAFDKVQAESETFDVMDIPGGYAVEFFEDVLEVLFFDTYAVVFTEIKKSSSS